MNLNADRACIFIVYFNLSLLIDNTVVLIDNEAVYTVYTAFSPCSLQQQ